MIYTLFVAAMTFVLASSKCEDCVQCGHDGEEYCDEEYAVDKCGCYTANRRRVDYDCDENCGTVAQWTAQMQASEDGSTECGNNGCDYPRVAKLRVKDDNTDGRRRLKDDEEECDECSCCVQCGGNSFCEEEFGTHKCGCYTARRRASYDCDANCGTVAQWTAQMQASEDDTTECGNNGCDYPRVAEKQMKDDNVDGRRRLKGDGDEEECDECSCCVQCGGNSFCEEEFGTHKCGCYTARRRVSYDCDANCGTIAQWTAQMQASGDGSTECGNNGCDYPRVAERLMKDDNTDGRRRLKGDGDEEECDECSCCVQCGGNSFCEEEFGTHKCGCYSARRLVTGQL